MLCGGLISAGYLTKLSSGTARSVSDTYLQVKTGQEILRSLSEGLLQSASRVRLQSHTLHIHHGFAPEFDPALLHSRSESFGCSLSIPCGREMLTGQRLYCDSSALPFQDGVFSRVLLHHVLQDGSEEELAEAVRVLARDGVLIIIGLNRFGWRYRTQGKLRALPGLSPFSVKYRLESMDMDMQGFAGAGLFNREGPAFMGTGLASLGLPVADVVLIQAGHRGGPEVTPLRFRKTSAGIVQSASLSG